MTNLFVMLLYGAFFAIFVILITPVLVHKTKTKTECAFLSISLLLMVWLLIEIIIHAANDTTLIAYLYTMRLGIFVFVPVPFTYLIINFFNIYSSLMKRLMGAYIAIASIFAILAFSGLAQELFWAGGLRIVQTEPLLLVEKTANLLYILLLIFTQVPIVCIFVMIISQGRKLPKVYQSSVRLLASCLALYALAVFVFALSATQDTSLDSSLIDISLIAYLIYLVIVSKKRADYLSVWQGDVFNYIDEAILVINDKGIVADANFSAQKLFSSISPILQGKTIKDLAGDIEKADNAFLRTLENENFSEMSSDLYITDGEYPLVYEIQISPIKSSAGIGSGSFIILNEVTRNRLFIERLQDLAGVDALTGLPNRFSYEQTLLKWDCPENLPLGIIVGDLNGLKKLNDSYGHKMGDILLQEVAGILKQACPNNGFVARIGGDEFVILLKKHDEKAVGQAMENIQNLVSSTTKYPELMSVALGSAVKAFPEQNMNMLYSEADVSMYEDKKEEAVDT